MELNGVRVSRETHARLQVFAELFRKWANSINLVAPSTLPDLWRRHIADSAQIFQLHPRPETWVDLGSGGGFPGVITAILLAELGEGMVHLVESNHKKAAFLRMALAQTGGRGAVAAMRIDQAQRAVPSCGALSARALAELDLLLEYSEPWLARDETVTAYFHKGRDYASEVKKAHGRWQFDLVQHKSVVDADSVVLEIRNLRRRKQI